MKQRKDFEKLADWLDGRLSEADAHDIEALLASDEGVWLQTFKEISQQVVLDTPPEAVRQQLRGQFAKFAEARKPPTLFQRLTAALTFDSQAQLAVAGVRSATSEGLARQLIYHTEQMDVALNIQSQKVQQLIGQIFPHNENDNIDTLSVQLLQEDKEVDITVTDEFGEFSFDIEQSGTYQLVISDDHHEVIIPALTIPTK